jgi:uncharacterized protein YkwD
VKRIIILILSITGLLSILTIIGLFVYFQFSPSTPVQPAHYFSGQELFNGINEYRSEHNLPILKENSDLCNNLVERWLDVKNPENGHEGFLEWAENRKLLINGYPNKDFYYIGELYIVDAASTDKAIDWWASSPGHRIALENPDFDVMCAYAAEGTGVVIVGDLVN